MAKGKRKGRSAAFMRSINPFLKAKRRKASNTGGAVSMAKRRTSRRRGGSSSGVNSYVIGGVLYGVARQPLNNIVKNFLPAGTLQVSDELLMGVVNYFIAKKMGGVVGQAAKAGLAIEASKIGASLNVGGFSGLFGGSSSTGSSTGATF